MQSCPPILVLISLFGSGVRNLSALSLAVVLQLVPFQYVWRC
jgi:hypothetical protein